MNQNSISLPPNADEVRRSLLRKGILLIEGRVNQTMFDQVAGSLCQLEAAGSPDIEVRICSGGGDCHFGFAIYDLLKYYKGAKRGVVVEKANSMASVILQACDARVMMKYAVMFIHEPSRDFSLTVLENQKRLKQRIAELKIDRERMLEVYLSRGKASREEFLSRMRMDDNGLRGEDVSLRADEALAFGLIDEIVI